jgi:hypothetical protein
MIEYLTMASVLFGAFMFGGGLGVYLMDRQNRRLLRAYKDLESVIERFIDRVKEPVK